MMQAAGAHDDKVLANYFPLALNPNVMSWLMHLLVDSISSWLDLCHKFVGTFTKGHQAPGQASDLHVIPQKDGESLRKYIQRFSLCSATSQMFIPPLSSVHSIRMYATARCVKSWR